MNSYPINRKASIVVQEFEKEILIYDLKTNKAFCLNETSALVWQMCDGKNSVSEISQSLNKNLKQPVSEDLVWLALDQFKRDELLENNDAFEIDFNGLSRRQVIKKIGFASMIALPIVSSIVAPSALMAQSGPTNLAINAACSSNAQCASGNCLGGTKCCASSSTGGGNAGDFVVGVVILGNCSSNLTNICNQERGNLCCSGSAFNDSCFNTSTQASYSCRCL